MKQTLVQRNVDRLRNHVKLLEIDEEEPSAYSSKSASDGESYDEEELDPNEECF
jgi:hypothetical protein